MVNILADRFNALKERVGKPDIRESDRAMKRLLKEVVKSKDILSANKNCAGKVGELADYVTLVTTVSRKDFETASESILARVVGPVNEVMAKAGLTID